ncbi:hypothetical protein WCX18_06730 [Sulfurimonas sp. HSL1-2]|uniref:hypothetical protein n=1 Tax=Thiomicrolovo zhangzhouensis TaxID=3131933 RepID=UPI0031F7F27B
MEPKKSLIFDKTKFVQVTQGFVTPPRSKIVKQSLSTVKECINSAIFMASQIELVEHCLSTVRPESVRPAFFRASLSELIRIEDFLTDHELPNFYKSNDPTLHLIKLLRNYQVHVAATELRSGRISVKLSGEEMTYYSFIAKNVSAIELQELRSAKAYSFEQLNELAMLFDSEQRKFGVVQLLYYIAMRVEEYAIYSLTNQKRAIKRSSMQEGPCQQSTKSE